MRGQTSARQRRFARPRHWLRNVGNKRLRNLLLIAFLLVRLRRSRRLEGPRLPRSGRGALVGEWRDAEERHVRDDTE